jgi:hypothetical protein
MRAVEKIKERIRIWKIMRYIFLFSILFLITILYLCYVLIIYYSEKNNPILEFFSVILFIIVFVMCSLQLCFIIENSEDIDKYKIRLRELIKLDFIKKNKGDIDDIV